MSWRDSPIVAALPAVLWVAAAFAFGPWWLGVLACIGAFPVEVALARLRVVSTGAKTRKLTVGEWTFVLGMSSAMFLLPGTILSVVFLHWHRSLFWWAWPPPNSGETTDRPYASRD